MYVCIYIMRAKSVYQVQLLGFIKLGGDAPFSDKPSWACWWFQWIHKAWKGDRKSAVHNL